MWNLFNFKNQKTEDSKTAETNLTERANTYFLKMEARSKELMEEVKESAQLLADADTDPYKRSYLQFKSGILAQFTAIIQKGSETFQNQILPKANTFEMMHVSNLYNTWQSKVLYMMTHAFEGVMERNLEKEYSEIMEEYNRARNTFHCKQCGARLAVKQFYFTATYLTCEFCQTQNTFDPGSNARMVEHMARSLAQSRCKAEYEAYRQKRSMEGQKAAAVAYERYVKAMIDQMNIILPGMEEQHQNFYNRLLADYNNLVVQW